MDAFQDERKLRISYESRSSIKALDIKVTEFNSNGSYSFKDLKVKFSFSDYQKSERDFAFIVNKEVKAKDLIDTISNVDESLIKDIKVFDVYEGDNIPENQKSIAISVTIQSSQRTLNDNDLEKINNLIIKTVEDKTGAKIRS